ncbi:hypothetical protein DES51_104167 [Dielma fastidiosa]|uniref:Uncharacterized protein n=1 Tax=Dielma fastidiosa TaxID=1034346 RepID=A0A318KUB4_9FIRM|nr:hypothetical protein DES51_104167 [Dielma fastidiosa]
MIILYVNSCCLNKKLIYFVFTHMIQNRKLEIMNLFASK